MKKLYLALGLAGVMSAPNVFASFEGTLSMTEAGGNYGGGGLFKAVTSANGTFDTFCLSIETEFTPSTTYNYNLSSTILANGVPPAPSYITYGTAYIYNQFRLGNATFGGNLSASGEDQILDDVQATIWFLQGLISTSPSDPGYNGTYGYGTLGSEITAMLATLESASGKSLSALEANGNGAFEVMAMNLYNTDGSPAQPQLAQVPEATTMVAGALLLLPFGASTLRILRKNRMA